MGPEYVSVLNHTNTVRELNRKLPLFMKVKWTECAGRIISRGSRPKFADFLQHVKDRAALVNNEFEEDITASPSKERDSTKRKDPQGRGAQKWTSLFGGVQGQKGAGKQNQKLPACSVCRGQHRLWKCDKFKISLIKTNGRWCGTKTFVSSVYRVVILQETAPKLSSSAEWMDATGITTHYCTPIQKIRALQVLILASRGKE